MATTEHSKNTDTRTLQGEIVLYQPDEMTRLEVRLDEETVWLTQAQIVDLFHSSKANISEHIKTIYLQEELEPSTTVRDFRTVRKEGNRMVSRNLTYYNLDAFRRIVQRPWQKALCLRAHGYWKRNNYQPTIDE